jgi:hypothetical protein
MEYSPLEMLSQVMIQLGCPTEKSLEMAGQLDKRARQLAVEKGQSYEQSISYLLNLMKQGWAAKAKGVQ